MGSSPPSPARRRRRRLLAVDEAPRLRRSARARGARAAPDRPRRRPSPCDGMTGWTPRLSISHSSSAHLGAHAGVAEREHLRAQQHHAAHLGSGSGAPTPRGVRAHEVALQLADVVGGDAHLGEGAEAGVDAVDRRRRVAAVLDAVDDPTGGVDARARVGARAVPSCRRARRAAMASRVNRSSAERARMHARFGSRALTVRQERENPLIPARRSIQWTAEDPRPPMSTEKDGTEVPPPDAPEDDDSDDVTHVKSCSCPSPVTRARTTRRSSCGSRR